jgi:metal-responsive CopG/Arc/MetJ family transcriptional regulator
MKTVQLMMEETTLRALDKEAKRQARDRSKIVREAVKRYLHALQRQRDDEAYAEAYRKSPADPKEASEWSSIQAWPED